MSGNINNQIARDSIARGNVVAGRWTPELAERFRANDSLTRGEIAGVRRDLAEWEQAQNVARENARRFGR